MAQACLDSCRVSLIALLLPRQEACQSGCRSARDYWAVVAYLLVRNGVIKESVPVGPATAEKILIKR